MNSQLIGSLDCVRAVGRGLMGSIVVYLQSALVYGSLYDSLIYWRAKTVLMSITKIIIRNLRVRYDDYSTKQRISYGISLN